MGKKFNCDIMAKSTFSDEGGTKICQQIETSEVKSIVKNDKLVTIKMKKEECYLQFRIKKAEQNKLQELLENKYSNYQIRQEGFVKLSIVGYGITQDNQVLNQVMEMLEKYEIEIMDVNLTQAKIEILVKKIGNDIVSELHRKLIKNS